MTQPWECNVCRIPFFPGDVIVDALRATLKAGRFKRRLGGNLYVEKTLVHLRCPEETQSERRNQ